MNIKKSKKKAANCLAITFLFLMAVILMSPSTTMAQDDRINDNLKRNFHEENVVPPDTFTTDQAAEADAAPQAPAAGGTYLIGTCYSSPLVIPAAAFSSDGYDPDSMFFSFFGGYVRGNAATDGCVKAPAYLPNGATITKMCATVYDNDTIYPVWVDLWRVDNLSGDTDWMATVETTGASTSVKWVCDTSIDDPLVVYPGYAYYVTSCLFSSNIRLYSVRIYFDGPS